MNCPFCQAMMRRGEVSLRQPGSSWFAMGPAALEVQFTDAEDASAIDLGISNDAPADRAAPDFRCASCGAAVIAPR